MATIGLFDDVRRDEKAIGMQEAHKRHIDNTRRYLIPFFQKAGYSVDYKRGADIELPLGPKELDDRCTKEGRLLSNMLIGSSGNVIRISHGKYPTGNSRLLSAHYVRHRKEIYTRRLPQFNIPKDMRHMTIEQIVSWLDVNLYYYFIMDINLLAVSGAYCIYFGKFGDIPKEYLYGVQRNKKKKVIEPDRICVGGGIRAYTTDLFYSKFSNILDIN
jgi:hypothetical protein